MTDPDNSTGAGPAEQHSSTPQRSSGSQRPSNSQHSSGSRRSSGSSGSQRSSNPQRSSADRRDPGSSGRSSTRSSWSSGARSTRPDSESRSGGGRPSYRDRPVSGDRPGYGDRGGRGERPASGGRADGGARPTRTGGPSRDSRGAGTAGQQRTDRAGASARPDRGDRTGAGGRPVRPDRTGGSGRTYDRSGGARPDRGAGADRGARPSRHDTRGDSTDRRSARPARTDSRSRQIDDDGHRPYEPAVQRYPRRDIRPNAPQRTRPAPVAGSGDTHPPVPENVDPTRLDRSVRAELRSLSKPTADAVGRYLVAAGEAVDTDPRRALEFARAARARAARVAAVREAVGVAAYHAGEWSEALTELRTARRISGDARNLALMADSERALGRPAQAVRLLSDPAVARLDPEARVELLIVVAGARRDLGQLDAALAVLARGGLDRNRPRPGAMRLWYAYADALEEAGRREEAAQWFAASAAIDPDGDLDAADRAADLI